MTRTPFRTRAELERQMEVARQLRAETLAGAGWIFSAPTGLWTVIRRMMLRMPAPHGESGGSGVANPNNGA